MAEGNDLSSSRVFALRWAVLILVAGVLLGTAFGSVLGVPVYLVGLAMLSERPDLAETIRVCAFMGLTIGLFAAAQRVWWRYRHAPR